MRGRRAARRTHLVGALGGARTAPAVARQAHAGRMPARHGHAGRPVLCHGRRGLSRRRPRAQSGRPTTTTSATTSTTTADTRHWGLALARATIGQGTTAKKRIIYLYKKNTFFFLEKKADSDTGFCRRDADRPPFVCWPSSSSLHSVCRDTPARRVFALCGIGRLLLTSAVADGGAKQTRPRKTGTVREGQSEEKTEYIKTVL